MSQIIQYIILLYIQQIHNGICDVYWTCETDALRFHRVNYGNAENLSKTRLQSFRRLLIWFMIFLVYLFYWNFIPGFSRNRDSYSARTIHAYANASNEHIRSDLHSNGNAQNAHAQIVLLPLYYFLFYLRGIQHSFILYSTIFIIR